jgi:hypothetical protein
VSAAATSELEPRAITAEDLGRIPPASAEPESSGPEAARAAAGEEHGAGDELGADAPPPLAGGEAALLLMDMICALGVQVAAQRYKVPLRDCAALARLSSDERELLRTFAPYAAPYLGAVGEASPVVGALAFAGLSAMILAGRFRDVRASAPASSRTSSSTRTSPSSSSVSREPPPATARVVDLEHVATWQGVADVVPPGTQVRDSGAFPDAAPSS